MSEATTVTFDAAMEADLSPEAAATRARRALRFGEIGERVAGFYLAELAEKEGYVAFGCSSMKEFIETHLNRSESRIRELMRIARGLRTLPVIDARFMAGRLNMGQVTPLIPIAVPETDEPWADHAEGRTAKQVRAATKGLQKGDLPETKGRRRIHEPTIKVGARLSATKHEVWRRVRQKFEAMLGRPVSDGEILLALAQLFLCLRPDGTIPGWTQVNDRHYVVHVWPRMDEDGNLELLTTGEDGESVPIDLRELTTGVRPPFASEQVASSSAVDLVLSLDPENHGPVVPVDRRDVPTGDTLRAEVLFRDGYQCRKCGSRDNVTVHHRRWRSYGGKTERVNLVSLCEGCHSLVHARLLFVLGDPEGELQFFDHQGRPVGRPPRDPDVEVAVSVEPRPLVPAEPTRQPMDLDHLPEEVDAEWWVRHEHLFAWTERQCELVLTPGVPNDAARRPVADGADAASLSGLGSLVGQRSVRERLEVAIAAARARGEQLGHVLFTGPPGLGKSSLARAVAGELGAPIAVLPAPHVRTPDALVRALVGLPRGGVVFLDELHALPARVGEVLYEAMDRGTLSVPVRQGVRARSLRVRVQPFTLVGATTDPLLLPRPLQSRFRVLELAFYEAGELQEIVTQAARSDGLELTPEGAERLARASRETPRRALMLLRSVRDEACVAGSSTADLSVVERALAREEVDLVGLKQGEREYLRVLEAAGGGPVGLKTVAAMLGRPEDQVETLLEPELLRQGYVRITPAGRVLASGGRRAAAPIASREVVVAPQATG